MKIGILGAADRAEPVPVNRRLIELVKAAERAGAGSPRIPSNELMSLVMGQGC